jgi:imidazolonepropionase
MKARIVRRGTAIELEDRGRRTTVRAIDLAPRLGELGVGGFAGVQVAADHLVIELSGEISESVVFADLPMGGRVPRSPDLAIRRARVASCDGDAGDPLGLADNQAVICGGGRILWIGPEADLDGAGFSLCGAESIDADGALVTPGLIDCHSHPIFAGDRAGEFARRARGEDYRDIAAAGGGIRATLAPTRAASLEEHRLLATDRLRRALLAGTTTIEAKSGYDLTAEGELRLLEIALIVDALEPIDVVPTLLGAHVVPPEAGSDRAGYVAEVAEVMVPAAAERGLACAVDVYCDEGAFTLAETRTILEAGSAAGLGVKAHVGQFADLGGPQLLAELGGLSGDHLEAISSAGIEAMAAHGVVAVMLPGACVQLRQAPPPVAALRAGGVAMAVASDMNPGSSYCESLAVPMWLATTHYQMSVEEAWLGVTRHAARALGRHDIGALIAGARADLVIWDAEQPAEIPYRFGTNLAREVIKAGRRILD